VGGGLDTDTLISAAVPDVNTSGFEKKIIFSLKIVI
jgi:hypothetical protein